jgi:hypothetical protein
MTKKLTFFTVISWLIALVIWQILFYSHTIVAPILWEIHTIFSSVIIFYILLNVLVSNDVLDFIKIGFRIVFKVWLIIFIAFSIQKSFSQKGFVLTATFIFGYLEGLIDVNNWLRNRTVVNHSKFKNITLTKFNTIAISIISISLIHTLCALIALLFFNIG